MGTTTDINNIMISALVSAWNENRIQDIGELLAEPLVLHGPRPDGMAGFTGNRFGKVSFLTHLMQIREALGEDARLNVQAIVSDYDRVAANYAFSGVHSEPYLGVLPSGRPVTLMANDQYLVRDGLIAEVWHSPDRFSLIDRMSEPAVAIPSANHLPAEVVAAFTPGAFPESLVQHPNGDIYVTLMFDGQLVRLSGSETSVVAQLPEEAMIGHMAGMSTLNVDASGRVIVAVISGHADYHGVWSYDADSGDGRRIAALPLLDNHLNGSAIDPEGRIYVADSTLGVIWQVVEGEPVGEIWCRDPLLARRDYVGLAPGANGLRYFDGHLYASVSDKATIVKIPVNADGSAGVATMHAIGPHGDDFAIDEDGTMYVTTHILNSIVKVDPEGKVVGTISDAADGIIGSTAAIISTDDDGTKWLYVTNDGGLLVPLGDGPPQPNVSRIRLVHEE